MASRRHRPSFPTSPRPGGPPGADDISHLTLVEVRDRLKRNERVLNQSGLFSPTPVSGSSGSPLSAAPTSGLGGGSNMSPRAGSGLGSAGSALPPAFSPSGVSPGSRAAPLGTAATSAGHANGSGQSSPTVPGIGIPGPSRSPAQGAFQPNGIGAGRYGTASTGTSPTTSVRDKLLAMRQALLEREAQLVLAQTQEGMEEMQLQESSAGDVGGRRRSSALSAQAQLGYEVQPGLGTSGKRLALERMMERDKDLPKNSLILPMAQTFQLAARDSDAETAAQLSNLAIAHTQSSSPKPRRTRPPHSSGSGRYPDSPTSSRTPRTARLHAGLGDGDGDEIDRAQYLARLNSFMGHAESDSDHSEEDDELAFGGVDENGDELHGRGGEYGDGGGDGGDDYFQDGLAAGAGLPRTSGSGSRSRGRKGASREPGAIFSLDDAEDDAPMGYPGDEDRLDLGLPRGRMERGTGEEIDPDGEDDERFAEGNDDYELGRGDGMEVDSRR